MITVEKIPKEDECDAYECSNLAEFLIGGLKKDYTDDTLLCRNCTKELVDKIVEEADG